MKLLKKIHLLLQKEEKIEENNKNENVEKINENKEENNIEDKKEEKNEDVEKQNEDKKEEQEEKKEEIENNNEEKKEEIENKEENKDMGFPNNKKALDGSDLDDNSFAVPCGLMAKTFFNDTFTFKIGNENFEIDVKYRVMTSHRYNLYLIKY